MTPHDKEIIKKFREKFYLKEGAPLYLKRDKEMENYWLDTLLSQRQKIREEIEMMFKTPAFISDDPLFHKITSELQDSYKRRLLQSDLLRDE